MATPLLSICMIVKNEIRCIEKCLKALQPLRDAIPCELVIADTGSTDGTREVAERYADILFDFTWINDFAAARNAVMDRCSGKWCFTVDADEYLDPDITELVNFLKSPHRKNVDFASIIGRNYKSVEMKEGDSSDFITLRLAWMNGIRYTGAVHEHWDMKPGQMSELLKNTVLHHDGYASDLGKRAEEKGNRNMELLRAELTERPEDLRLLLQCVESCRNKAEQAEYIHRGMTILMSGLEKLNPNIAAAFFRYCARYALENRTPEAEVWLAWGEEHFAKSIFFRIDVTLSAALYYLNLADYERALDYGDRYCGAYSEYQAGKYNLGEVTVSTLGVCLPEHYTQACQLVAKCQMKLGRTQEALDTMRCWSDFPEGANLIKNALVLLQDLEKEPGMEEGAEELCARWMDKALSAQPEDKDQWNRRTVCLALAAQMFGEEKEKGWRVLRRISHELGVSARVMDESRPEVIVELTSRVERWKEVPNPVIFHIVEIGAPLPDGFYRKGAESLRNTAAAFGKRPGMAEKVLVWMERDDFASSMTKFQFLFELTAAVMQGYDWNSQEVGLRLVERFCALAADYLPNYYNAELLSDREDRKALPGLHRFALDLLEAQQIEDETEYVRALRAALEDAPAMKKTVDFLLKHRVPAQTNPELVEMARQIQTALAQFQPDDPAVRQLLERPEYQKLLPLLGSEYAALYGVQRQPEDKEEERT